MLSFYTLLVCGFLDVGLVDSFGWFLRIFMFVVLGYMVKFIDDNDVALGFGSIMFIMFRFVY